MEPTLQDETLLRKFYPYLNGPDMYDCADEDSVPFYWDCEVRHFEP